MKNKEFKTALLLLCLSMLCCLFSGCGEKAETSEVNTVREVTLSNGDKVRRALSNGEKLSPELAQWAQENEPELYQEALDAGLIESAGGSVSEAAPEPTPEPTPEPVPAGPTPGREWVGMYYDFASDAEMYVTWSEDVPDKIKIKYVGEVLADFDPDSLRATGENGDYSVTVQFEWHAGQYRMVQSMEMKELSTGTVYTLSEAERMGDA
jgi:hypothetical protein